ncbi:hypothetical protein TSOC_000457 [Tetrabaena socialis]|uniref:Uncharacterized protein n=1 Tax=Tetrabaena socialis TaxID=47790 RepID=A0A2J8AJB6_9CHLO|nr:hypothetical protein TSOC_000457 [Tetrabaena socialis]|eukprot:PNH12608.1 hypothetical protein TSOC_000457 [Tetrabaena socialis]
MVVATTTPPARVLSPGSQKSPLALPPFSPAGRASRRVGCRPPAAAAAAFSSSSDRPAAGRSATANAAAATVFSPTSTFAQAAAASAAQAAAAITTLNPSGEVAVWTSDRPLRRLPASLDGEHQLRAAARCLPGYRREEGEGVGDEVLAADGLPVDFSAAERALLQLLRNPGLDARLALSDAGVLEAAAVVRRAADAAVQRAYGEHGDDGSPQAAACHTFLQRLLYRINRLNHFWYDDLRHYDNERSAWVAGLRDAVEAPWQRWEATGRAGGVDGEALFRGLSVEQLCDAIRSRAAVDVDPPPSSVALYQRDQMGLQGYRHLLAVGASGSSLASKLLVVLFLHWRPTYPQEYGGGKLGRKHSTFYHSMMAQLGLDTRPEAYFDLVPWQWLAGANHNFLLTERRRHYLRYLGGLTFFEVNGPAAYRTYCAAAQRLGLPPSGWGYWELHVREDERHGRQMVEEVAVPLIQRYGEADGWEVLWGYDQEVAMGQRAGEALVADIKAMEAEEAAMEHEQQGGKRRRALPQAEAPGEPLPPPPKRQVGGASAVAPDPSPDPSRVWLPDLVPRFASFLTCNEVACILRLVNKAAAAQFSRPEDRTVRLSLPVPHREFARRWGGRDAVRSLTLARRRLLPCLTARSGSIANLKVLLARGEWLAGANHNFLLTERRRHYLRYLGGLTFFGGRSHACVNGPAAYRTYCAAAQRLGLPPSGWGYWELHVREDERHGRYGEADGWEVLWGYDQEVAMGQRAGEALVADIKAMEAEEAAGGP